MKTGIYNDKGTVPVKPKINLLALLKRLKLLGW